MIHQAKLPFPLEVDPATGGLVSDGQPMITIPRRYYVYLQMEAERIFGQDGAERLFDAATRRGARVWCENEQKLSGAQPEQVFERYLERISSRGMGRFRITNLSVDAGNASVDCEHSIFVAEYGTDAGRNVCSSFSAALAGAMEFLRGSRGLHIGHVVARETSCRSNGGARCLFEVSHSPA
jgi:predicted hydrocarbon binding protein